MKIGIIYDRVNKIGGAERVLEILHEIWPDAPLYTSICDLEKAPWAKKFQVKTSFLQWFKFLPHEILPNLMPAAFSGFNFNEYDVVLSVSSAEAKYIKVSSENIHINYCLTPTRYLWSGYFDYLKTPGFGAFDKIAKMFLLIFAPLMRMKDFEVAQKIDKFIAISEEVKLRIWKYYRRKSTVVYPPVSFEEKRGIREIGERGEIRKKAEKYFLIVSRLVPYKQIDMAIRVFNDLDKSLIIVGTGVNEARLKKKAKDNIIFKGQVSDNELSKLYNECVALIYPGIEDFGLTSLEAQAFYKPVICNKRGGTKETLIIGKTGEVFKDKEELKKIVLDFKKEKYRKIDFDENLKRFNKERFKNKLINIVDV